MRDPRRSEIGDARPDRTDPPAADAAEVVDAPADGDAVVVRSPDPSQSPATEQESAPAAPDTSAASPEVDDAVDGLPDDLFFDPLLSDEPIDLAAVRADDALIDALGGNDLDAAQELVDPDDPLIAMLAAWAAAARPEEPEPTPQRPPLALVPEHGAGTPDGPAADQADETDDDAAGPATVDLDAPTLRLAPEPPADPGRTAESPAAAHPADGGPAADDEETTPPTALPLVAEAGEARADDAGDTDDTEPADPGTDRRRALFTRRVRRRPPGRRPQAPDPFRRAAAVVVLAALGVSVAAAAGGTAQPGDPGFAITRVFFAERARSLEAAEVVAEGLERAREHLRRRQPALAAQELAAVDTALPDVRDQDGHNRLVDQQQVLATAVALTPPDPRGADRVETPTTTDRPDPDTSVLAEAAPPDTTTSDSTTTTDGASGGRDVVTSPSTGARSTTGTAGDPATTGSGTTGSGTGSGTGGSGTSGGAPVVTSTVGGTTDTASVTAEPTTTEPTTSVKPTKPSRPTTTRTSDPADPTSTTSRTKRPTRTTSPDDPDTSTARDNPDDAEDTAKVATGSVKVQPAAHHVWTSRSEAPRTHPAEPGPLDPADDRVSRAR